jgi:plastocyanin
MNRTLVLLFVTAVLVVGLGGGLAVAQEASPTADMEMEEENLCPESTDTAGDTPMAMEGMDATPEAMAEETGEAMAETPDATTGESPAASPAADGEACEVEIENSAFVPANIEVAAGTTVTWENYDDPAAVGPHTVTADDGSFDSGNLEMDQTFSHTFDTAGDYAYHCENHPNMTGSVTVS